ASALDGADTPAVEALRAALPADVEVRLRLPAAGAATSHLLRAGLSGAVQFEDLHRDLERRRHPRYSTRVALRIALADDLILTGVTEDLSRGGLRAQMEIPAGIRAGTDVHAPPRVPGGWADALLSIDLPELGLWQKSARVVHHARSRVQLAFAEPCP